MAFTQLPDKATGDVFTEELWDTIAANFNSGVWRPISDTTLGTAASSVDLSSIAADWTHLVIHAWGRGTTTATSVALNVTFNGDTSSNYDTQTLNAAGSTLTAAESFARANIQTAGFPAASGSASRYGAQRIIIPFYTASTHKTVLTDVSRFYNDTTTNFLHESLFGVWRSTAAITQVTLTANAGNLDTGTRVTLYGVGGLA